MSILNSHPALYNACLNRLQKKGFTLSVEDLGNKNHFVGLWYAEKNGFHFKASNPIELMGLCAIYEAEGEPTVEEKGWWSRQKKEDIWKELTEKLESPHN